MSALEAANKLIRKLQMDIKRLRRRRDWWRRGHGELKKENRILSYQFYLAAGVAGVLGFVFFIAAARRPADSTLLNPVMHKAWTPVISSTVEDVATSPSWVRSTVLVRNGGRRCSGTVISIGDQSAAVLSAAHCFKGRIRGVFEISDHNGDLYPAQLVAINRKDDLALFQVPTEAARGVACVPTAVSSVGEYHKIGYTNGKGPKWGRVTSTNRYLGDTASFRVLSGPFGSGDSGGTIVFCPGDPPNYNHGQLVAVISAGEGDIRRGKGHEIVGPNLIAINRFLDTNWDELVGVGKRRKRCPE